jgi:hypothetical protein
MTCTSSCIHHLLTHRQPRRRRAEQLSTERRPCESACCTRWAKLRTSTTAVTRRWRPRATDARRCLAEREPHNAQTHPTDRRELKEAQKLITEAHNYITEFPTEFPARSLANRYQNNTEPAPTRRRLPGLLAIYKQGSKAATPQESVRWAKPMAGAGRRAPDRRERRATVERAHPARRPARLLADTSG